MVKKNQVKEKQANVIKKSFSINPTKEPHELCAEPGALCVERAT